MVDGYEGLEEECFWRGRRRPDRSLCACDHVRASRLGAPRPRRGRARVCARYLILYIIYNQFYAHIILSAVNLECDFPF